MKLQTKIPLVKKSENLIDYKSNILLLGSCFSENIGDKFNYYKFQSLYNPFGILFNPKAIENLLSNAINDKQYDEKDILYLNEQWYCFDAHSKLSSSSKEALLASLNEAIGSTRKQLHDSTHIIITLGTSWIYRYLELNKIVANCHKVPQKQFQKELLSIKDLGECFKNIIDLVRGINPDVTIIFTVSPVRHLKDGFVENTRSKSHLISAIHEVLNNYDRPLSGVEAYFPSYEIMMDELRDYRFYEEDMMHPTQTAINYIWQKFVETWISKEAIPIMDEVDSIQKGLQHKPFNAQSIFYKEFQQNLEGKIKRVQERFPCIKF